MPQSSHNHPTVTPSSHNDPTFNTALQWELEWVSNHPDLYEGPLHQQAVRGNIAKRYAMTELTRLVKQYADSRTTGDQIALFEHIGVE